MLVRGYSKNLERFWPSPYSVWRNFEGFVSALRQFCWYLYFSELFLAILKQIWTNFFLKICKLKKSHILSPAHFFLKVLKCSKVLQNPFKTSLPSNSIIFHQFFIPFPTINTKSKYYFNKFHTQKIKFTDKEPIVPTKTHKISQKLIKNCV